MWQARYLTIESYSENTTYYKIPNKEVEKDFNSILAQVVFKKIKMSQMK
jgi:hypothetical protein